MKNTITLFLILFLINSLTAQTVKEITLEGLFKNYEFYPRSIYNLSSMNDGEHYTVLENSSKIAKYSYKTGEKIEILLNTNDLGNENVKYIEDYEFSKDETKVLLKTNSQYIYRRSFTANYFVYDFKTKKLNSLSENGRQQLATFSPDGTKIAFVRTNNLYIKDLATQTEIAATTDGKANQIINAAPDWVYEEEFEFARGFEWSPDSKKIAYFKFDESKVKVFNMYVFKGLAPEEKNNALYPENRQFKYPKAGEDNSKVSVQVYSIDSKTSTVINTGNPEYIPRIKWTNNPNLLGFYRLNRHQDKLDLCFANLTTNTTQTILTDSSKYYIDENYFDYLTYLEDGKQFIFASEKSGFLHLYLYDMQGKLIRQLTKGNFDVTNYLGYDSKNKQIYYQAAEKSPLEREIYSVSLDGKHKTCLSTQQGTNNADFSSGFQYYINYFSNSSTPTLITLHDSKGKLIRTLEENKELKAKVKECGGVNKEFFKFKTSEGVELNGWIIKPYNFDATKKYPVFMTQYSGPNSQQVLNTWRWDWHNMLAQKGYIIICVDGRGTGARGSEFRKMTYLQLGKYETIDQMETAKYAATLPYVDAQRIGIWGWSYGGFMTALCMTKGADLFKMGISVAPVTNWIYYDNIYTERFMRTPQENPSGYADNSPINHVSKLKGKYLIIHGTADDNVHVQNTMEFTEALVQANKQFEEQIYTNRNHGIRGGNTTLHLYNRMTNFILQNL